MDDKQTQEGYKENEIRVKLSRMLSSQYGAMQSCGLQNNPIGMAGVATPNKPLGLATVAAELQKFVAELEATVEEARRRLFNSPDTACDNGMNAKSEREWPIAEIVQDCSQRVSLLCAAMRTVNNRLE